jgi:hypothetical protein
VLRRVTERPQPVIDLPSTSVENLERLADWAELCAFADGEISAADCEKVFQGAGLAGYAQREFFAGDEAFADEDTFSEDETAVRLADLVWEECRNRAEVLEGAYPFDVDDGLVLVHEPRDSASYMMLLVIDLVYYYEERDIVTPSSESSRLFEKVVEASHIGLLGGPCSRFGWPIEPDWPTAIDERIDRLGEELGLVTEGLYGKTDPLDKDRGLDVAGRARLHDTAEATYALLTQCATGRGNWKDKKGEPSIAAWHNIFQWHAVLLRAIALPWRLEGRWNYCRTHQYFEAVVLDRPRLMKGDPDQFLADEVKSAIHDWAWPLLSALPSL